MPRSIQSNIPMNGHATRTLCSGSGRGVHILPLLLSGQVHITVPVVPVLWLGAVPVFAFFGHGLTIVSYTLFQHQPQGYHMTKVPVKMLCCGFVCTLVEVTNSMAWGDIIPRVCTALAERDDVVHCRGPSVRLAQPRVNLLLANPASPAVKHEQH
jgi:hypothetical protein